MCTITISNRNSFRFRIFHLPSEHNHPMLTVFIRTIIIYFSLMFTIRLMGKRQIGELQLPEFIITFLISEIASVPITDPNKELSSALFPMLFLMLIELAVSFILMKSNALRRLFTGTPSVLVLRSELLVREMKKNRIEIEELLASMRQNGYASLSEIRYAILEVNGKISIIPNRADSPPTLADLGIHQSEPGIDHPLILDGVIVRDNLTLTGWTEKRLMRELRRRKLSPEDVFLMTADDCGKVSVISRS